MSIVVVGPGRRRQFMVAGTSRGGVRTAAGLPLLLLLPCVLLARAGSAPPYSTCEMRDGDCPKPCRECGSDKHRIGFHYRTGIKTSKCFNCEAIGHESRDCPAPCGICGSAQHKSGYHLNDHLYVQGSAEAAAAKAQLLLVRFARTACTAARLITLGTFGT